MASLYQRPFQCKVSGTTSRLEISVGMTFWGLLRQATLCYTEFKRAVDACGKFNITETQNESSQKSNKFPTSAQEEVQTEFVFVKIPKLWQMFGKIMLGVKVPKLWQFFGKIRLGKLRARAIFRKKHPTERQWTLW